MPDQESRPDADPMFRSLLGRVLRPRGVRMSADERLALLGRLRETAPERAASVDQHLVTELDELRERLAEIRTHHRELERVINQLTAPPWHYATFVGRVDVATKAGGLVMCHGGFRAVAFAADLDVDSIVAGDDVLLSRDMNVILARADEGVHRAAETAVFQYRLDDGRLVLAARDATVVARPAGRLEGQEIPSGTLVRWDPALSLVFECIPQGQDSSLFLEETPRETFADVGGLDAQIRELEALLFDRNHPDVATQYGLTRPRSVLLVGPTGTGKTMLTRALANHLAQESAGGRSRFMNIKPGALSSKWYAESEANIREVFRVARESGRADPDVPIVLFFDEVDSIAASRGQSLTRVDDRVLTSLLAELDGFGPRGNVLVVAATNRRDALDPAALREGRLGDLILEVPRPNMAGAAAILDRHLPEGVPYLAEEAGASAAEARDAILQAATSRIYAPNGEGAIATLTFRDGTQRPIAPRDVVTGSTLAKIGRVARQRAARRHAATGEMGVRLGDVLDAVRDELDHAAGLLTPANCALFVSDLPDDKAIASISRSRKTTRRAHMFVSAA